MLTYDHANNSSKFPYNIKSLATFVLPYYATGKRQQNHAATRDRSTKLQKRAIRPATVYLDRLTGPSAGAASLLSDGRKNLAAPASTKVLTIDSSLIAHTTSQSVIRYLQSWRPPWASCMVGGVAQWLERRSLAGRLSLIYAWSVVDMWPLGG